MGALAVSFCAEAQSKEWTLQQCVDTAVARNRTVKQQTITKKNREIAYDQARKNLLPNLNASATQNWTYGRSLGADNVYSASNSSSMSFGINSSLTLFDGMKMKYNIDVARANMKASEADLDKIRQDLMLNVALGYMQILLNKELLQVAQDQLNITRTKIEQRKVLVDAGKLAEGELLDLVAQEAKEDMSRLQAENTLNLSLLDLAQLLELDDFSNFDVVVPEKLSESDLQMLSADEVFRSALTHRPEIKGAEYLVKSSEYSLKVAQSAYYPTLSLGASYGSGYYRMSKATNPSFAQQLGDNKQTQFGLTLSVPIFNKFEVRNGVRTAQLNVSSSKVNVDNAKIELRKNIQQAYYNAVGAKARWDAALKSETASREAYRYANQKYEAGRASIYELYQAKSNLTQVLGEEAQAKYQYYFRVKVLEYLK